MWNSQFINTLNSQLRGWWFKFLLRKKDTSRFLLLQKVSSVKYIQANIYESSVGHSCCVIHTMYTRFTSKHVIMT